MKERLTGAIILVVLIVLLVPELLSGPSRSAPASQTAATSSEEPPLRSYTIDLADESRVTAASTPSQQATGPAQPTTIVESPPAQPQPPAQAATAEPTQVSPSPSSSPSPSPAQATVTPPPPAHESPQPAAPHRPPTPRSDAPEPRSSALAPAAGNWMVQLGVFAKRANADRLAQELKEKGFHTQVSEVNVGNRTLWRVRAGPVAERAGAEQLSAKLRTAGHPGAVVPK